MQTTILASRQRTIKHLVPGLGLTALLTLVAMAASEIPALSHTGLSALTLAILGGIAIGNLFWPVLAARCAPGIQLARQQLLRLGIIFYGFRITGTQLADVGFSGALIDVLTLSSTFFLACWLGQRLFALDRQTCWLIGAGSSICGAAAVLATAPVAKANASSVTVAIATVVLFGTLAMFIYPALWPLMADRVSPQAWGIFTVSTVHEVAQVVVAGHAVNAEAERAAVIAKMLRVMLLAPFLLCLAARLKDEAPANSHAASRLTVPWFALLFIAVTLLNSLNLLPPSLIALLIQCDTVLLAMAMAALGLTTHLSTLKQAGIRPLLLGLTLFAWLIVGGGAINLLVQRALALRNGAAMPDRSGYDGGDHEERQT